MVSQSLSYKLKKVTSKLNKVNKVASNHALWVTRPSTQLTRYVPSLGFWLCSVVPSPMTCVIL
jgi:hypothetical protein